MLDTEEKYKVEGTYRNIIPSSLEGDNEWDSV